MRCNRAADEEGFQDELFKLSISVLGSFLSALLNRVVCTGFLDSWSRHVIYSIHRTGSVLDPDNYRTIMIGHTFAKLCATTKNTNLSRELARLEVRSTFGQIIGL